jgi:hypothetical protein
MKVPMYWRVIVKGGRKAHLTPFVKGRGSGDLALCQKSLPEHARTRGSVGTVFVPHGDECDKCLRVAGFKKRPELTLEQQREIERYRAMAKIPGLLQNLGLSDHYIKQAMLSFFGSKNSN